MSRILKVILFIIAIFVFFEVGLFASYSIISSEPVNPSELLSLQIDQGSQIVSSIFNNDQNLSDQNTLNITNKNAVGLILENKTGLSININSLSAKVSSSDTGNQTVTISAVAYKDSQSTSGGAIVISPEQTYSVTATATGEVYSSGKVKIDTSTISIKEKIVLYNSQNGTGNNSNASINSLVNYTKNGTNSTNGTTVNTSN